MALKKIAKGDIAKADDYNALVDEINRLANIRVSRGLGLRSTANGIQFWLTNDDGGWLGIITSAGPAGEDDYDDERYWVAPARVTNDDGDDDTAIVEVDSVATSNVKYQVVTVTNIFPTADHTLAIGTPVWVYEEFDDGDPSTLRYLIDVYEEAIGMYPGMVHQVVAANTGGWDWEHAHAVLP